MTAYGAKTVDFVYGADRRRVYKHAADGTTSESTWYVGLNDGGALYEQTSRTDENGASVHEHRHYLYAGDQPFGVYVQREVEDANPDQPNAVGPGRFSYFHRDRLGSVTAVTDEHGRLEGVDGAQGVELAGYDPWGKRRNPDWSDTGAVDQYTDDALGRRGFTGHESIAEVGLIHMNGRVYDPALGRFLSADPHIQFSDDTQSYNRYSYVQNNPLKYTDPSGYFLHKIARAAFRAIGPKYSGVVIAAVSYSCGYAAPVCAAGLSYQAARAFGASSQQASRAGGNAMFTAMATMGIGEYFGNIQDPSMLQTTTQYTLHGVVGGLSAQMAGGSFADGFVSAFLTKALSPGIHGATVNSPVLGIVMAGMVGGTISELTGGKFANGAQTAALAYALNQLRSQKNKKLLGERRGTLRDAYDKAHAAAAAKNAMDFYDGLSDEQWAMLHAPELLSNDEFTQGGSLDEVVGDFDSLVVNYSEEIAYLRIQQRGSLQAIFLENFSKQLNSSASYAIDKSVQIVTSSSSMLFKGAGMASDHAVGFVGERGVGVSCSVSRCGLSGY